MKNRYGFVSNSSSTSFTCNICGRTESGWDLAIVDAEMCECERNHIICQSELLKTEDELTPAEKREYLLRQLQKQTWRETPSQERIEEVKNATDEKVAEMFEEEGGWDYYCIPSIACPICMMKVLTDDDCLRYLSLKGNITKESILKEIRETFVEDYDRFDAYLRSGEKKS